MASTDGGILDVDTIERVCVPSLEDDPAERKRVLNILAQRRYRKRKKEQLANLNQKVAARAVAQSISDAGSLVSTIDSGEKTTNHASSSSISSSSVNTLNLYPATHLTDSGVSSFDNFDFDAWITEPTDSCHLYHEFELPLLPFSEASNALSKHHAPQALPNSGQDVGTDQVHLPMLELSLLRGAISIAQRLQVDDIIWSLDATSPFPAMGIATDYSYLPGNLQPTRLQLSIPHHPALDILPWPGVRDKLILVFSQPLDMRPPNARTETALVNFVYDLEDSAEGVRIWGDDPYSENNWEIGLQLFKNWWWALDRNVLQRSNELRSSRGASLLGPGSVVEL